MKYKIEYTTKTSKKKKYDTIEANGAMLAFILFNEKHPEAKEAKLLKTITINEL